MLVKIDDLEVVSKCGTEALISNSIVTTKVEMKKLEFNVTKCKKIHIGRDCLKCCDLLVHEEKMEISDAEKYLGDIVMKEMNNIKNIKNKEAVLQKLCLY